jgi:hypothetical protein
MKISRILTLATALLLSGSVLGSAFAQGTTSPTPMATQGSMDKKDSMAKGSVDKMGTMDKKDSMKKDSMDKKGTMDKGSMSQGK